MRVRDWAATPLGPPAGWPQALKTAVSLMLAARQPVYIGWGPDLLSFYNDGYLPIVGLKHPGGFGLPFAELWAEIWDEFRPIVAATMAGEAQHFVDLPIALAGRPGLPVGWFTFSYTPLRDDAGAIGGFFCAATETTGEVLAARRRAYLLALNEALRGCASDTQAMMGAAARLLGEHLGVAQAGFGEVDEAGRWVTVSRDWNDGRIASVAGTWRMDSFGPAFIADMKTGRTVAIPDVALDPRTSAPPVAEAYDGIMTRSILDVPRLRGGRMAGMLFIHHPEPREWTAEEVATAEETCERLWDAVERARTEAALAEGEARLRLAQAAAGIGIHDYDIPADRIFWDARVRELWGVPDDLPVTHAVFAAGVHPDDLPAVQAAVERALDPAGDGAYAAEYRVVNRRDGTTRRIAATGQAAFAGGRAVRLVGTVRDVTARRGAEAALAESEARFRALAEALPQIVWTADAAGRLDWHSPRWTEYSGLPASGGDAPTAALDWRPPVHPDDLARTAEAWAAAVASGAPYEVEHRIRRRDGAWRWFLSRAVPQRAADGGGAVLRWFGTATDIHDRRAAEEALREGEARLRATYAASAVGLALVDRDLRFVHCNEGLAAIDGVPAADHVGRTVREVVPLLADRLEPLYRSVLETGVPVRDMEVSGETAAAPDAQRWWLANYDPVPGPGGGVAGVGVSILEITARKATEAALAESEAALRRTQRIGRIGTLSYDFAVGRAVYSPEYLALHGLPEGHPGETREEWLARVHPEDRARADRELSDALAGRAPAYESEFRVVWPGDGSVHWIMARGEVERDPGGAPLRLLVTQYDVTAQRLAEAALAESEARFRALAGELEARVAERTRALADAARELQAEMRRREEAQAALLQSQKMEALGQLTGGVAHDFNNLLAAVQGGYRLLERRVAGDPKAEEFVRHGMHAAERGARLVAGLMSFVRGEEPRPALTDPVELLRESEDLICHAAASRVRCSFEPAPGTWPVLVDPSRLVTALLNLAANARDAMPAGGTLVVSARNATPGEAPPGLPAGRGFVRVAVSDTGAGMDAETLRRAAEPFFTTKPRGKGTGLGLASVQRFCAESGGALRLRSAPGEGTTVEIFLPRAAAPSAEDAADADAGATAGTIHGAATILVADDDDAVRLVTATVLRDLGYRVLEAAGAEGAEALMHAQGGGIDMLVTDVAMGGAAGPVLAARLRAERPGLPVLYVTGHGEAATLGGAPVLRKPFTDAALARAVLRGLGRISGAGAPAAAEPLLADRLRGRLRRPVLRDAHLRWLTARGLAAGALPSPVLLPPDDLPESVRDNGFLVEVLPVPEGAEIGAAGFRFLHLGKALEERLGRPLAGVTIEAGGEDGLEDALGGSLGAAYRRCARNSAPFYDYARFAFGDGEAPVLLERLLLPLSADGVWVTHLLGVATYTPDADGSGMSRR